MPTFMGTPGLASKGAPKIRQQPKVTTAIFNQESEIPRMMYLLNHWLKNGWGLRLLSRARHNAAALKN
jgi:hypothetical protein